MWFVILDITPNVSRETNHESRTFHGPNQHPPASRTARATKRSRRAKQDAATPLPASREHVVVEPGWRGIARTSIGVSGAAERGPALRVRAIPLHPHPATRTNRTHPDATNVPPTD